MTPREAFERNKLPRKKTRQKVSYVGVPTIFKLQLACSQLHEAFCDGGFGIYHVGSSLERADWRDVDIVCILDDKDFAKLFPDVLHPDKEHAYFEHDPRWLLMTVWISDWLAKISGVPVDFKFQPQTHANARHSGQRHAMALRFAKE